MSSRWEEDGDQFTIRELDHLCPNLKTMAVTNDLMIRWYLEDRRRNLTRLIVWRDPDTSELCSFYWGLLKKH